MAKKRGRTKAKDDLEQNGWLCTVCTLINRHELFKCEACCTRKGTSTRKPRLNPSVVQHHTVVHNFVVQQNLADKPKRKCGRPLSDSPSTSRQSPESTSSGSGVLKISGSNRAKKLVPVPIKDSLIVRSSFKRHEITVDGMTAIIYEYKNRNAG